MKRASMNLDALIDGRVVYLRGVGNVRFNPKAMRLERQMFVVGEGVRWVSMRMGVEEFVRLSAE